MPDEVVLLSDINFQKVPKVDQELREFLRGKIVIANLEGYITDNPTSTDLGMPNDSVKKLRDLLNIRYVSLANNHTLDGGLDRFRKMEEVLQSEGIICFGTREKPYVIFEVSGKKIGVLAFAWRFTGAKARELNLCWISLKKIIEQVNELKLKTDYLIVYPHWGIDLEILPTPWQVKAADKIIDAGAHLIVGHHAHEIQPRNGSAFYSIGNTYLPKNAVTSYYPDSVSKGFLVSLMVKDSLVSLSTIPTIFSSSKLKISSNQEFSTPCITCSDFPQEVLKNYTSYYRRKRVKRVVPVFTGNFADYLYRIPYMIALESLATMFIGFLRRNRSKDS
ncbi:MAG: Bacterial capsule synthesis protein [Thermotogales bacterium 46_20]|nr:MAG: Bacterial capsule synthesis protein [Thermotogales bacterium 46_20]